MKESQAYSILLAANERRPERWFWGMRFVNYFIFQKPFLWARNLNEFGEIIRCLSWVRGETIIEPDRDFVKFTTTLSKEIQDGKISLKSALTLLNEKFDDETIIDWWGYCEDLLTSEDSGAAWIRESYWNEYYKDVLEISDSIPDEQIDDFIDWLDCFTN